MWEAYRNSLRLRLAPPHRRPLPHRIEKGPVALFDDMPLRERRARFLAQRAHHPVVEVGAEQHHAVERDERRAAFLLEGDGHLAAVGGEAAERRYLLFVSGPPNLQ